MANKLRSERYQNDIKIDASSKNIVVYVFTAPEIQEKQVSEGIQLALEILEKFGNGKDSWWKVFKPEET